MKLKKRIRSLTAMTLLLALLVALLWGVCMYCITIATAQNYYDRLLERSQDFIDHAADACWLNASFDGTWDAEALAEQPWLPDSRMLSGIDSTNSMTMHRPSQANDGPQVLRNGELEMETAVQILNGHGSVRWQSGTYVYFSYATGEQWATNQEHDATDGFAYLDLNDPEDERYALFHTIYSGVNSLYDIRALKITGVLDGLRLEPVSMAYVTEGMVDDAVDRLEPVEHTVFEDGTEYILKEYTLSGLDRQGLLPWYPMFDQTNTVADPSQLVTVYALSPRMCSYESGDPVTWDNDEEFTLMGLLDHEVQILQPDWEDSHHFYQQSRFTLEELVVFGCRVYRDYGDSASGESPSENALTLVTAIRSRPLASAISELRNVYIFTGLLALLGVLLLRRTLRRHLTDPLTQINEAAATDRRRLDLYREFPPKWQETADLYNNYTQTSDLLRIRNNEITRLNTALNYAQTAEQLRRQMTSDLAHELKTPLAVVHSYAEGLQEHIAEEKREQYLQVILSETERMDELVRELLDLSRLEAGRVKLARDTVSLPALAQSVFGTLELVRAEKQLRLEWACDPDSTVTADEARLGQVIRNFASNAVKYTPAGGCITVRTRRSRTGITFAVENTAPPLSDEALSKVWDAFYRGSKSRSDEGTGLGLTISKRIVELHGGTIRVRNTDAGVEFSFTLPR